jgi:hypothetical protein
MEGECNLRKEVEEGRLNICVRCHHWVPMREPWKHEEQYGHPALIEGKYEGEFFYWRSGRPLSAGWLRITYWMRARARLRENAAWRWGKLLTFGVVLLALWGYVSIGLQPVIDVGQTYWWRSHELQADLWGPSWSGSWGFCEFWLARLVVFTLNCLWFIFWTWLFATHNRLRGFRRNLEQKL